MFRSACVISAGAVLAGSSTGAAYADCGWDVVTSTTDVAVEAAKQVGGGGWTYGSKAVGWTTGRCYSNDMHRSKSHGSTARRSDKSDYAHENAGLESRAAVEGWRGYNCVVNWNTY